MVFHANGDKKRARAAICIPDKTDFQTDYNKRQRRILHKGLIQEEDMHGQGMDCGRPSPGQSSRPLQRYQHGKQLLKNSFAFFKQQEIPQKQNV